MKWRKNKRADGRTEWVCEHGVGHTDVRSAYVVAAKLVHDAAAFYETSGDGYNVLVGKLKFEDLVKAWLTHECDGCCKNKDFPGAI